MKTTPIVLFTALLMALAALEGCSQDSHRQRCLAQYRGSYSDEMKGGAPEADAACPPFQEVKEPQVTEPSEH